MYLARAGVIEIIAKGEWLSWYEAFMYYRPLTRARLIRMLKLKLIRLCVR